MTGRTLALKGRTGKGEFGDGDGDGDGDGAMPRSLGRRGSLPSTDQTLPVFRQLAELRPRVPVVPVHRQPGIDLATKPLSRTTFRTPAGPPAVPESPWPLRDPTGFPPQAGRGGRAGVGSDPGWGERRLVPMSHAMLVAKCRRRKARRTDGALAWGRPTPHSPSRTRGSVRVMGAIR